MPLRRWLPDRKLVFVGDANYAALALLHRMTQLPNPIMMVTRFRMDAALYAPAPPRQPGQKGRPRVRGHRVPKLRTVADDPCTQWLPCVMGYWYGQVRRRIELATGIAVWTNSGQPVVPIRWVIIRDPLQRFKTQPCCAPT